MKNFIKIEIPSSEYQQITKLGNVYVVRIKADSLNLDGIITCYECTCDTQPDIQQIENQLQEWLQYQQDIKQFTDNLFRMKLILNELDNMDYLTSKEIDGEDMSKYNNIYNGDWHEYRRNLRLEYNNLEQSL